MRLQRDKPICDCITPGLSFLCQTSIFTPLSPLRQLVGENVLSASKAKYQWQVQGGPCPSSVNMPGRRGQGSWPWYLQPGPGRSSDLCLGLCHHLTEASAKKKGAWTRQVAAEIERGGQGKGTCGGCSVWQLVSFTEKRKPVAGGLEEEFWGETMDSTLLRCPRVIQVEMG